MEKRLKGKCLYTPNGAAREYAAVGCNFYRGCPYQCRYCYNRTGMTAKVMGLDHAVLEEKFANLSRRSKRYQDLSGEDYAFLCFRQEVGKWKDYLRQTGIFFSFSTDPFCEKCFSLTWRCVSFATREYGIPVKVLTKNAGLSAQQLFNFGLAPKERREKIAFGFTLTGCDYWEPYAPKNIERIRMMRILHEKGFHTFASIEPIVDFDSSYMMIEKTEKFCDQFLIGLMSSRKANGLEPYDINACKDFICKVHELMWRNYVPGKTHNFKRIYWKESIRNLMENEVVSSVMKDAYSTTAVGRDWSLFTGKNIEL